MQKRQSVSHVSYKFLTPVIEDVIYVIIILISGFRRRTKKVFGQGQESSCKYLFPLIVIAFVPSLVTKHLTDATLFFGVCRYHGGPKRTTLLNTLFGRLTSALQEIEML